MDHITRAGLVPGTPERHVADLLRAIVALDRDRLHGWGRQLAKVLSAGGRLLAAGNGGSAAQAQHLTAELVGRYLEDRRPLSALALHADTSTVTAVGNDFGYDEVFARQVRAHGRPNDVLIVLSTSGRSPNIIQAVHAARDVGMVTWALTGPDPNPLREVCDDCTAVDTPSAAAIQECHLVAVHLICAAVDEQLRNERATATESSHGPRSRRGPVNLVVIGDVLVDRDITGSVERISPEAPVPVVGALQDTVRCGGAGLTACLAAGQGHHVTLITALSLDDDAFVARRLLAAGGVTTIDLGSSAATAVKTRVRASEQTLLMLDHATAAGKPGPLSAIGRVAIAGADVVVVSDYGRGVAAAEDVRAVLTEVIGRVPIVWDPHPRGPTPVPGTTLVTPNSAEARGFSSAPDRAGVNGEIERALDLRKLWDARAVVVTRGRAGAVLVNDEDSAPLVIPAPEVPVVDTCGAGDMFAVAAAALLGSGALPSEAVTGAVAAAADFVASAGRFQPRSAPGESGEEVAARVRAAGGTVVATGGCFDLLHRGHVAMLEQARKLGDCLIVCLNDDVSVTRLKGEGRPLVAADDREAVLRALACVDAVVVFQEDTPAGILARLRPHVWVKGGDYAVADLPERAVVEEAGGVVVLVPYLDGRSSTSLIERAVRRHPDLLRRM